MAGRSTMAKASLQRGGFCFCAWHCKECLGFISSVNFTCAFKPQCNRSGKLKHRDVEEVGLWEGPAHAAGSQHQFQGIYRNLTAKSLWGANTRMYCREPRSVDVVGHSNPGHQPEEWSRHSDTEQKNIQTDWQTASNHPTPALDTVDVLEGCEAQLKDCCSCKQLQARLPHWLLA